MRLWRAVERKAPVKPLFFLRGEVIEPFLGQPAELFPAHDLLQGSVHRVRGASSAKNFPSPMHEVEFEIQRCALDHA